MLGKSMAQGIDLTMSFLTYGKIPEARFKTDKGHWVLRPFGLIPPYYVFYDRSDMHRAAKRTVVVNVLALMILFTLFVMQHGGLGHIVEALPWGLYFIFIIWLAAWVLMFLIVPKRVIYRKKIHGALIPEQKPE